MTKTATVSLHGNSYEVDPALVGRKVELVFDPFDLTRIEVASGRRADGAGHPAPHRAAFASESQTRNPVRATETQRHRLRAADRDRARRRTGPRRQLRRPLRRHGQIPGQLDLLTGEEAQPQ